MPSVPQDYGRMGHYHDTYAGNEKLAPMVREIGLTFDLLIMEKRKDELEGQFYLTHTRTKNCHHWWQKSTG
jgi:hypothetical protein